jgi:hypothetical protein
MDWIRQGTRRRRRPGITWKLTTDWELQNAGKRREEAKGLAVEPCAVHK